MTDTSGNLTDAYSYNAFGELFSQTGDSTNSYLFTGQQYDTATGLYSMRARYYDPAVGRFLTQDTYPVDYSNPLELNRYVYVANNPIRHTDPSGHLIAEIAVQVKNYWQAAQQTAVARMVIGAAAGAVLSGFHASFMYDMARNGHCGDNLKDWALRYVFKETLTIFVPLRLEFAETGRFMMRESETCWSITAPISRSSTLAT